MKRNSSPSSPRFATPLRLRPVASTFARQLAWGAHLSALLSLPFLAVPLPWRLLLGVLLAASLYRASRAPRWREIRAAGDGTWRLIGEDGETREAVTAGPGLCHPWLVILDLRLAAGRRLRVPLFPDTLSASEFKALRRRLALPASQ